MEDSQSTVSETHSLELSTLLQLLSSMSHLLQRQEEDATEKDLPIPFELQKEVLAPFKSEYRSPSPQLENWPFAENIDTKNNLFTFTTDPLQKINEQFGKLVNHMQHQRHVLESKPLNTNYQLKAKSTTLSEKQKKTQTKLVSASRNSTNQKYSTQKTLVNLPNKFHIYSKEKLETQESEINTNSKPIMEYLSTFISLHKKRKEHVNDISNLVIRFHNRFESHELRLRKKRMLSLKKSNEKMYLKLIEQTKRIRLNDILKQTDEFLQAITHSVFKQQKSMKKTHEFKLGNNQEHSNYYDQIHYIKETVHQPKMMTGGQLKDYQMKGLEWMISLYNNYINGILADEMGLGKTIQTIALISYIIEIKKTNGPFLIIAPLSTLSNWKSEFDKWSPEIKKVAYVGKPKARKKLGLNIFSAENDCQVILTTFELATKDQQTLAQVEWLYIIIDEGHRMKNINSKVSICLRKEYKSKHRLILSGTPLQNNLPELWALLNFLLPKIFQSSKSFEEWFNSPFITQGFTDQSDLNEEEQLLIIKRLHTVLRPFLLRRLKTDVEVSLPDKVEYIVKCQMSSLQLQIQNQLKAEAHVEGMINPNKLTNELIYRCSGKFEVLDRMLPKLQQTRHRVLIFFQMTKVMNIMEDYLSWKGYYFLRLDGSVKIDERHTLITQFNKPSSPYFIFLLSTRAGGTGLNLQTADTVILFDSDWNPHQDLQAQGRAHRIGQTQPVHIYRFVTSNSIEEKILEVAQHKLSIDGKVIQAGKFDNRSTEKDREALLRTLLENKIMEAEKEDTQTDMNDCRLNNMLKRSDKDLEFFKQIDMEKEVDMRKRLIQEDELPKELLYIKGGKDVFDVKHMQPNKKRKMPTDQVTYSTEWNLQAAKSEKSTKRICRSASVDELDLSNICDQELFYTLVSCYSEVEQCVIKDEKMGQLRKRCAAFLDNVQEDIYPLYYKIIKNPICMRDIKKRIYSGYYKSIEEFQSDFHLMFENAKAFNEESSTVYKDAEDLKKIFDAKVASYLQTTNRN
ncbi:hypothetical protein G6F37_004421 [Rhizopus arrhizus]|nr:hypothetical protein G6F38_001691 [Rhizopus arrhizus]KAG1159966.1 hypothetical protein G6F37_004421 [Rhizopus arrhizus]